MVVERNLFYFNKIWYQVLWLAQKIQGLVYEIEIGGAVYNKILDGSQMGINWYDKSIGRSDLNDIYGL